MDIACKPSNVWLHFHPIPTQLQHQTTGKQQTQAPKKHVFDGTSANDVAELITHTLTHAGSVEGIIQHQRALYCTEMFKIKNKWTD